MTMGTKLDEVSTVKGSEQSQEIEWKLCKARLIRLDDLSWMMGWKLGNVKLVG